jgi:hypothetical protein
MRSIPLYCVCTQASIKQITVSLCLLTSLKHDSFIHMQDHAQSTQCITHTVATAAAAAAAAVVARVRIQALHINQVVPTNRVLHC